MLGFWRSQVRSVLLVAATWCCVFWPFRAIDYCGTCSGPPTPRGRSMLTMLGSPRLSCDGMTRRETLIAGALPLLGGFFNLPSLMAIEKSRDVARPGKAKSVLFLYLQGGPATQDMFDLKPDAPDNIRSQFKPMATNVPGIELCEHLPKMARWMHKAAIVRSAYHKGICHSNLPMYTGFDDG